MKCTDCGSEYESGINTVPGSPVEGLCWSCYGARVRREMEATDCERIAPTAKCCPDCHYLEPLPFEFEGRRVCCRVYIAAKMKTKQEGGNNPWTEKRNDS